MTNPTPLDVDELDRILLEMMNPIDYKNTLFSICGKKHPQPVYSPNNVKTAKQALLTYIKEEQEKARHEVIDLMVENLKDTYQKIFMYETIYGAMYDPEGEVDVADSYVKYQELEPERAKFADWLESQRNRLEQS
jgi:hypothetical protein